ncbi:MAG: hypothetical protein OIF55_13205 [Amphritea sp.]|nr:hypothetical protein [Amphritea sp.]
MTATDTRILYLTDPLCGWCYAAAPLLQSLMTDTTLPGPELIHRALFTGQMTRWMSRSFSDYVMQADRRIAELTGQTFSRAYRDNLFYRNHLIFDSWPTAKAIEIIRNYNPDQVIPFFKALQQARFIEGKVITDASILCELAAAIGLQADLFHQKFHYDERVEQQAYTQQQRAATLLQQVHYDGVPCFILQKGETLSRIPHEHWLGNPDGFRDSVQQLLT